jgi:hypothetical protein
MNVTAHPEGKAALTLSGRLHDGNKRRGSNTILTMRAIIRHSNVGQLKSNRTGLLAPGLDRYTPNRLIASRALTLALAVALSSPTSGLGEEPEVAVDLELVIAVDVSASMSQEEQRVQRAGYVSALRNPDVLQAIKSGRRGRIAMAYFEWARPEYQRVLVPWTVIDDPADADAIADAIASQPSIPQGGTSISSALRFAGQLLKTSRFMSDRRIVDVSGDGPNNAGSGVESARDALIARGVTINGLVISLPDGPPDMVQSFDLPYLESYYRRCVIGGSGAFVLSVGDLADFEKAIRRKFVAEIAGPPARLHFAAQSSRYPAHVDCLAPVRFPGR